MLRISRSFEHRSHDDLCCFTLLCYILPYFLLSIISSISVLTQRFRTMSRRTRSGLQFSPFQVTETPSAEHVVVGTSNDLSRLVERAFATEDNREDDLEDDIKGLELDYMPPNSPTSRAQDVSDSELSSLSELSEDQPSENSAVAKRKGRTGKGHAKRGAKKRRKAKRAREGPVHPS